MNIAEIKGRLYTAIDAVLDKAASEAALSSATPQTVANQPPLYEDLPMALLPDSAKDLIRVIGLQPALALIQAKSGQVFMVPKGKRWTGQLFMEELAEIMGQEAVEIFCRVYGGMNFTVPSCKRAFGAMRQAQVKKQFDALTQSANPISARAAVNRLASEFDLSNTTILAYLKIV